MFFETAGGILDVFFEIASDDFFKELPKKKATPEVNYEGSFAGIAEGTSEGSSIQLNGFSKEFTSEHCRTCSRNFWNFPRRILQMNSWKYCYEKFERNFYRTSVRTHGKENPQ